MNVRKNIKFPYLLKIAASQIWGIFPIILIYSQKKSFKWTGDVQNMRQNIDKSEKPQKIYNLTYHFIFLHFATSLAKKTLTKS